MPEELYSIAQIARIIDIPESTCRYYRNTFPEHFHAVGKGKKKKYSKKAIDTLRFIAAHLRNGNSLADVAESLKQQFPQVIELAATTATIAQVDKFPLADVAEFKPILQQLTKSLMAVSDYKHELNEIKNHLRQLQQESASQKEKQLIETKEALSEAERLLQEKNKAMEKAGVEIKHLRLKVQRIEEMEAEVERLKRPWWKRIFA